MYRPPPSDTLLRRDGPWAALPLAGFVDCFDFGFETIPPGLAVIEFLSSCVA